MFRPTLTRAWDRLAAAVDDLLAADYDFDEPTLASGCDARQPTDGCGEHPHRAPLRTARERRPGRVPAAPAQCTSPVRAAGRTPGSAAHS